MRTFKTRNFFTKMIKQEIINEASDVPKKKIKRAGGGVAYMLGE